MSRSPPRVLYQTALCLAVGSLLVYSLQEVAVSGLQGQGGPRPQPAILPAFSLVREGEDYGEEAGEEREERVWVTMALCWGENAQVNGKEHFPYSEAAVRSVQLWHHLTPATVLLTIVHTGSEPPQEMLHYRDRMQGFGAKVSLVESEPGLGCVLTAQLVRLLAYENTRVGQEDVIITADVDAFIMTGEILRPLRKAVSVWVWRYELSYNTGYTFMMPFIGARKKTWSQLLHYNGSLAAMVQHYRKIMGLSPESSWDLDQHILTYAIIAAKFCSLQRTNPLWKELGLQPQPFRDSSSCWHGSGIFEDCNNRLWERNIMIRYQGGGCKWWHFYPDEGVAELEQKFQEVMAGKANNGLLDWLVQGARGVKKNVIDGFLTQETVPQPDPSGELDIWSDHANN